MRRTMRKRPLALVIFAHVAVVGLLLMMERRFSKEHVPKGRLVYVLPITQLRPAATFTPGPPTPAPKPAPRTAAAPVPAPPGVQRDPEPATVPAPVPRIDWQRELQRSVQELAKSEEPGTGYRSLDAEPDVLELPEREGEPPPSAVTILPNGDKVAKIRVGDRLITCVSPRLALDEHFAAWAQFRPSRCSSTKLSRYWLPPPASRDALKPAE